MTQLELGLAPVQRDRRLAVGDRVLVPETADGQRLPSRDAAPLGTVVHVKEKGACLVHIDGTKRLKRWPESHLRSAGGRLAPALLEQLLADIEQARAEYDAQPPRWHSGPYDVPGAPRGAAVRDGFTHMIRAANDPERQSREARRARLGGVVAASGEVMRSRKTRAPEVALEQVLALLGDGKPRTLNAIGVELWDQTADMVDDRIWWTIVDAVEARVLEHSMRAPILIRLRVADSG